MQDSAHRQTRASNISLAAAICTISIGVLSITGWIFDLPALKSVLSGFVAIKANTAIGLFLCGLSLALLLYSFRGGFLLGASRFCAIFVVILGAANIIQYAFNVDLGIDQLIFEEPAGTVGTLAPGRMAPMTAVNFLLFGGALYFSGHRRTVSIAQRLALTGGLISLVPLLGYLYGAPNLYGVGYYAQLAVHTAAGFVILSLGVLLVDPAHGLMQVISRDTMGRWLLVRLAPIVTGVPVALGWIWAFGERNGLFEGTMGAALTMIVTMFLLGGATWWTATVLNKVDAIRRAAEERMRESEERHRTTLMSVGDAVLVTDTEGRVERMNPVAVALTGWTESEAVGKPLHEVFQIVNETTRQAVANPALRVLQNGMIVELANHTLLINRNGAEYPIADSAAPILTAEGNISGVVLVFRDQATERAAQKALRESEERYRSLFNGMLDGYAYCEMIFDEENRPVDFLYLEINEAFERLTGLKDVVGRRVSEVIPGVREAASEMIEAYGRVARTGNPERFEINFTPLAKSFYVSVYSTRPGSFIVVFHDITERIRAAAILNESEEKLRLSVQASNIGLWDWDLNDNTVYYSPEWKTQIGYRDDEITNDFTEWKSRLHPDDLEDTMNRIAAFLDDPRGSYEAEFRMRHKEGHYIWVYTRGEIYRDNGGKPQRMMGCHIEITERKKAEEALRRKSAVDAAIALLSAELLKPEVQTDVIAPLFLRHAQALTESTHGFISSIDPRTSENVWHTLSESALPNGSDHAVPELAFPRGRDGRYSGLWGHCLNTRTPFFTNDPAGHASSTGTPEDHFPLRNFLSAPVVVENEALGQIALANSRHDFTAEDAGVLQRLSELYGLFLRERRTRDRLQHSEEQLRQSQKMEAVGRLAGGVAHDFNNMLQTILGYADLALADVPAEGSLHESLEQIQKAALRSAELTKQLLAFARKQTIAPRILDPNEAIAGMLKMFARIIGEDIAMVWKPGAEPGQISMDPSQLHQILANLVVNARDAIEGVGQIAIETAPVEFDRAYCRSHTGVSEGRYVMLAVSDDGCGMDRKTQSRIFEPFFTTKPMGKGTGLGLATVYGIVNQNNGFINVYSEPGEGTTFRIYLPRVDSEPDEVAPLEETRQLPAGSETVLVVEDEESLLQLARRILEHLGYNVLTSSEPLRAIDIVKQYPSDIHVLVTDVIMPGMSGADLWQQLSALNPRMRCIFMSGYTADVIAHHGILEDGIHFLSKPFTGEALAFKIREVLEG